MQLLKLVLTSFRNHENLVLDLAGKPLLITGANGSGKSNILEAVHLLATTKSMRARYDKDMISHDKKFAKIGSKVNLDGYEYDLELSITRSEKFENSSSKKAKINGVAKSLTNFIGTINTVLFTPSDIQLFTDSPSQRRKYIDSLFFQVDKNYKRQHSSYTKAVRQRNKLLEMIRDENKGHDQLEYWEEKIITSGSAIQEKRQGLFDFFEKKLPEYGHELNGKRTKYEVLYDKSEISKARLDKYRDREVMAKATLVGPHRDDFQVVVDDFDISSFGSRGQKRTTLLGLKLCEIDFIWDATKKRPILLLDDIFSELDNNHKEAILKIIDLQQTLITSAESVEQLESFADGMKTFNL
jgi:DNA replication and repair protein RecF